MIKIVKKEITMQVLKFGGTSVSDAANMAKVADIVSKSVERDRTVLICSAVHGFADSMVKAGTMAVRRDEAYKDIVAVCRETHHDIIRRLLPFEKYEESLEACDRIFESLQGIVQGVCLLGELSEASLDAILACGELLSSRILATKMASMGVATRWVDSREIIRTVRRDGQNIVDVRQTYANMEDLLAAHLNTSLFVAPGSIASDSRGRTITLGRGGSDYTASLFSVGCNARVLEIWTDAPGIMTANPIIVPGARLIGGLSYRAAQELSHFSAKAIYPPAIQPVVSAGIPIYVKNTFVPEALGTLIEKNPPRSHHNLIGISNSDDIALLSLEGSGMVGIPGFSSRLFDILSRSGINIILITQASSVHTMCIAVAEKDADRAKEAADAAFAYEISLGKLNPLKVEKGYSIVCLVGDDILNQCGTTGRMLAALGRHSISIRATAQGLSERNISVIVSSGDVNRAIRYIHDEFFAQTQTVDVNLFIAGYGTVGRTLVDMIAQNGEKIARRTGKRLHVAGLSNSRKFVIDLDGLPLDSVGSLLEQGRSAADEAYFDALADISLENSVFVDCTPSSDIAYKYMNLFKKGYSVVACNKITFSAPYKQYMALKQAALENGATLRYETTVGAALPILESISRCINSGDTIHSIEAVLSGTLNYIFSAYDGGRTATFAEVVRQAQRAGYTEADPRLDLSGRDVLRKLLILSREAGVGIDESDVEVMPLLGPEFFEGKIDAFYRMLEENEPVFASRYAEAASAGLRQRFIASLVEDPSSPFGYRARMTLETIAEGHPLYHLAGTDNAAIIRSDFYPSPLLIQGAGAGACQTASGVLNDILM